MSYQSNHSFILMISIFFLVSCNSAKYPASVIEKELNSDWQFRQTGSPEWMPADVPGSVVADLYKNKKIPDPFFGSNCDSLRWIEKFQWECRTLFNIDDEIYEKKNIELFFKDLNSSAMVFLNDSMIFNANLLKRENRVNCKTLLNKNNNILLIRFNLPHQYQNQVDSVFVNFGIRKSILLRAWEEIQIRDCQLFQESLNYKKAVLKVQLDIQSLSAGQTEIKIEDPGKKIFLDSSIHLIKGINHFESLISFINPNLWWPNGLGQPNLYTFKVSISKDDQEIENKTLNFGFRKIQIVNVKNTLGESPQLMINDIPLYIKGADFQTQDIYYPQENTEKLKFLVESATKVKMNLLRVSDDGLSTDEEFYKQCDQNGILVWQNLSLKTNVGADFYVNPEKPENQFSAVVNRIRNHPCLAFWSALDYISDKTIVKNDENRGKQCENAIEKFDSGRIFLSDELNNKMSLITLNGSGQYLNVISYQSYPLVSSMLTFLDDKEFFRYSGQLKSHQKKEGGFDLIQKQMLTNYKIPGHIIPYVLVSQIVQAENLAETVRKARRNKDDNIGIVFKNFNEYWPSISNSGVDYYGHWKALQYYLKKLYAPVIISSVMENKKLKIFLVSDEVVARKAILSIHLLDFYGNEIWADDKEVKTSPFKSILVYQYDLSTILADSLMNKSMLHIKLNSGKNEVAYENLYFKEFKNLEIPDCDMVYNITKRNGKFVVQFMTDYLAKNVFIDYPEDKGNFSDNYFDLLPGEQKTILFTPEYPGQKFEGVAGFRSLYDIY